MGGGGIKIAYLIHYGVLGMKWGVRKDRSSKKIRWADHVKKLSNYKGRLYFISEKSMDGKTLTPRVARNFFTENGYEDPETKRVSFAPTIDQCLMGISANLKGKTFYVYSPDGKYDIYKPDNIAVPDSIITDELWICEPVKVKMVEKIYVKGSPPEKPGLKFTYGNGKSAHLYEWDYEKDILKHDSDRVYALMSLGRLSVKRLLYEA